MSNILTNNINARSGNTITIGKAGDKVSVAGSLSYEDVTSVDSVGLITARSGIHVTGAGSSVGIGTNSPGQKLTVYNATPSGTGGILVQNINYGNGQDKPYLTVGTKGWTGATDNWNTHGFEHRMKSNSGGTARITVDSSNGELFCIQNGGNIGIGTDNPTHEVSIGGSIRVQNPSDTDQFLAITHQGIDFGNTGAGSSTSSTSHLLDDYEEGDWTPFIRGATTGGTITHSQQHGSYTKIGSLVTLRAYISWSAATGTGQLRIYGMPFVNRTHEFDSIAPGPIMNNNITYPSGYTMVNAYVPSGTDHINVYFSGTGVAWSIMQMEAAGSFIFDISYRTA